MKKRYYDIDILRFVAAVAVMTMHYLLRGFAQVDVYQRGHYGSVALLFRYNYLAVNLFFIISGFVILMSAARGGANSFL